MNSILGQEAQMLRVRGVLEYLASEGLIANVMDSEIVEKMVRDKLEDVSDLSDRFWEVPRIVKLMGPFSGHCRRACFPHAEYLLFDVVACDRFFFFFFFCSQMLLIWGELWLLFSDVWMRHTTWLVYSINSDNMYYYSTTTKSLLIIHYYFQTL